MKKLFKGLFKREETQRIKLGCILTTSCEDENTMYFTFPDGLRLIIRNGEYDGWYVCKENNDAN